MALTSYLAAVGVLFATVFVAQIVAALGYGHVFPWSVPAVYRGIAGSGQPPVSGLGISLVLSSRSPASRRPSCGGVRPPRPGEP